MDAAVEHVVLPLLLADCLLVLDSVVDLAVRLRGGDVVLRSLPGLALGRSGSHAHVGLIRVDVGC